MSKVFLDSRFAQPDGKTFLIPGEALLLNPESRCWLAEFTCVASWDTIDSSNNTFQITETFAATTATRTVTLFPPGPHDLESLRSALQESLNFGKPSFMGDYTVSRLDTAGSGSTARRYGIEQSNGTFVIPSATNNLRHIVDFPHAGGASSFIESSFVDVRRVHSIYLHSSLGNFNCIAPTGVRGILAKIPVHAGYGGLVTAQLSGSEHDCVEVGCHSLSSVQLSLHDVNGVELDRNATSWSCTLVFER